MTIINAREAYSDAIHKRLEDKSSTLSLFFDWVEKEKNEGNFEGDFSPILPLLTAEQTWLQKLGYSIHWNDATLWYRVSWENGLNHNTGDENV